MQKNDISLCYFVKKIAQTKNLKNMSLGAVLLGMSALPQQANASIIAANTIDGPNGVSLELEIYKDKYDFKVTANNFDINQAYFVFNSAEDVAKLDIAKLNVSLTDWNCITPGNYVLCDTFGHLNSFPTFQGSIEFKDPSLYEYSGRLTASSDPFFFSDGVNKFDILPGQFMPITTKTQTPSPSNPVPAPATLGLLGLSLVYAIRQKIRAKD